MKRSHYCGDINTGHNGEIVVLMGWVQRRRDHGGLIFVDLRDIKGLVQVVFSPDLHKEAFHKAEGIRSEYVLAVRELSGCGLKERQTPNLATGQVEVLAHELRY